MKKYVWRMCKSKKRYRDEHTANLYRRKFEKQHGKKLDYYWCPYCSGFHLTSLVYEIGWTEYEIMNRSSAMVG